METHHMVQEAQIYMRQSRVDYIYTYAYAYVFQASTQVLSWSLKAVEILTIQMPCQWKFLKGTTIPTALKSIKHEIQDRRKVRMPILPN